MGFRLTGGSSYPHSGLQIVHTLKLHSPVAHYLGDWEVQALWSGPFIKDQSVSGSLWGSCLTGQMTEN